MIHEKTAVVLTGGAMKCAYTSGALLALQRHFGFTNPDIIIAASGSVPAMLYFITGQYRYIEKLWTDTLGDNHKILGPTHLPILDIDYLVDKISKNETPLDMEKLRDTKIKYLIPLRDAETGDLEYISNNHNYDIYEVIRASMAVPIAYGKEVSLGDKKYIDGFYAVTVETLINKAIKEGATRIIAIDCNPMWSDLEEIIETYTFKKKFGLEDKNFYEKKGDHNGAKVIDIYPTRELPTSLWEVDKDDMVETFFIGYQNMSTNKNVAECINHKKRWLI